MSRSARAFQSGTLPMITVSMTRNWSKANWSWRRTPNFLGRVMEPLVGSMSPVRIFIRVDLPAPLGLAGAVGTGDGVTTARQERAGDVFEQSSGAEAHGDVVDGEQSYYHDSARGDAPFGALRGACLTGHAQA